MTDSIDTSDREAEPFAPPLPTADEAAVGVRALVRRVAARMPNTHLVRLTPSGELERFAALLLEELGSDQALMIALPVLDLMTEGRAEAAPGPVAASSRPF